MRLIRWFYPKVEVIAPKLAYKWSYRLFFTPFKFKRPGRELPILKNAQIWYHPINKNQTAFYSWGEKNNPLVVFAHGWMGRATQFHNLIEAFLEANYRVIAFDGPAHGDSKGKSTDLRDFSEALAYINQQHGPIETAIGHSFGGVAVLFAIANGLPLKHVVMVASPVIGDEIIDQFVGQINGTSATADAFKRTIKKNFGFEFNEFSASHIIKRIKLDSLLIVHDAEDKDVPIAHSKLVKNLVPAAHTHFTNGLGHTRILRDQETTDFIVKFVENSLVSTSTSGHKRVVVAE